MDPFHVVRLAGDALDACRRRVQQDLHGHRGRTNDPLYRARRTLHTGHDLLTDKQTARLEALFAVEEHVEVEATWGVYQRIIGAYRHPDRAAEPQLMQAVIDALSRDVPTELAELRRLGRTLRQRAADVLAYFTRPGTSNGPTEAINGRLEHLRGSALGFRNLTNYIARCSSKPAGSPPPTPSNRMSPLSPCNLAATSIRRSCHDGLSITDSTAPLTLDPPTGTAYVPRASLVAPNKWRRVIASKHWPLSERFANLPDLGSIATTRVFVDDDNAVQPPHRHLGIGP